MTKSELETLIALAEKASLYTGGPATTYEERCDYRDYKALARTAAPQIAKQLMEAMVILDRLMKEKPHGEGCSCNWCKLIAAYHAQEKKDKARE